MAETGGCVGEGRVWYMLGLLARGWQGCEHEEWGEKTRIHDAIDRIQSGFRRPEGAIKLLARDSR